LLNEGREKNWFAPAFVYQFFPAGSDGNDLHIYDPEKPDRIIETFQFPRQEKLPYRSISDYVRKSDENE
ncbi:vitamin B12 dependent-methionine synthase activation domain-containing protein, partial [Bacillus safensis]